MESVIREEVRKNKAQNPIGENLAKSGLMQAV